MIVDDAGDYYVKHLEARLINFIYFYFNFLF